MIPVINIVGLAAGRWWLVPIAAVAWPIVLVATNVDSGSTFVMAAGALAALNAAVGVAAHRLVVAGVRALRAEAVDDR